MPWGCEQRWSPLPQPLAGVQLAPGGAWVAGFVFRMFIFGRRHGEPSHTCSGHGSALEYQAAEVLNRF